MLPGFQLILGLGALFTADVRQRAEMDNMPDKATPEGMALFTKYLDIKAKADVYPDEDWPRYRVARKGMKTTWKRLAAYWNTSIHGLQMEYFEWKCEQLGIEYNYRLVLRVYHRDDVTGKGWHYPEYNIEPSWSISEQDDPRVKEDKEKKRKAEEEKRREEARLNSPEREKLDDEIRARRAAHRAERLAREAEQKNQKSKKKS